MEYLVLIFLLAILLLLGMITAQILKIEKRILDAADAIEEEIITRIE